MGPKGDTRDRVEHPCKVGPAGPSRAARFGPAGPKSDADRNIRNTPCRPGQFNHTPVNLIVKVACIHRSHPFPS